MPLARVHGIVVAGVAGALVSVEVDVADGLPSVGVVGLPDTSVSEARLRARCAVQSIGRTWPNRRITISLSPAELRKHGSGLDLPIAVAVLAADGQVPATHLPAMAFIGELGLDGRIRPTRGTLAGALAARRGGLSALVVPSAAAPELGCLTGLRILVADHLADVGRLLEARALDDLADGRTERGESTPTASGTGPALDLRDVRGHLRGRLALEVAAAGGHHLALVGPPGVGKTLLAERLPGLLPDLGDDDAIDVAALHSVAGVPRPPREFRRPPFRAPHHSASSAAVLGSVHGGRVTPGAVTMAHAGVLLLDEAPEFARPVLEGLRQPLESGVLWLDRAGWRGELPARVQLVLAANPCPCGLRSGTGAGCSCPPAAVRRYAARLSGPLLDRIDIRLAVSRPTDAELAQPVEGESTAAVRDRVELARERCRHRLAGQPWACNAAVPAAQLRRRWPPDPSGAEVLQSLERGAANLRGPDRVLRLAWSLADLAGRPRPGADEIALAASLRGAGLSWTA